MWKDSHINANGFWACCLAAYGARVARDTVSWSFQPEPEDTTPSVTPSSRLSLASLVTTWRWHKAHTWAPGAYRGFIVLCWVAFFLLALTGAALYAAHHQKTVCQGERIGQKMRPVSSGRQTWGECCRSGLDVLFVVRLSKSMWAVRGRFHLLTCTGAENMAQRVQNQVNRDQRTI